MLAVFLVELKQVGAEVHQNVREERVLSVSVKRPTRVFIEQQQELLV